jgi:hypothetical protein
LLCVPRFWLDSRIGSRVRHDLEFIYQNETDAKSPQFFLMSVDQVVDMYVKKSKLFGLDFEFF